MILDLTTQGWFDDLIPFISHIEQNFGGWFVKFRFPVGSIEINEYKVRAYFKEDAEFRMNAGEPFFYVSGTLRDKVIGDYLYRKVRELR